MRSFRLPSWIPLLPALALAACDGDPSGGGPEAPAALEAVSGGAQRAAAGSELPDPVVVRVLDDDGDPVPNVPVNFVVTGGGGSVSVATALTDGGGRAQARWTLGTSAAAAQTLEARVSVGATTLTEGFTATAEPGPPAGLQPVGPQARTGAAGATLDPPLAVRVVDQHGNGVPGVQVSWSITAGGGALSAVSAQTDAEGVARATWTLGGVLSAPQTARAALGGTAAVDFTATASIPADAVVEPLAGHGATRQAGGGGLQLTARVATASGVPISGAQVTFASPDAGGQFTVPAAVTDGSGRAATFWTPPPRSGVRTAVARVAGAQDSAAFEVTVTPAPFAGLEPVGRAHFELMPGQSPGVPLRVRAHDRFGNGVPGVRVVWSAYGEPAPVSPAETVTGTDGIASAEWQPTTQAGTRNFTAFTPAGGNAVQFVVIVRSGPLFRIDLRPDPWWITPDDNFYLSFPGFDAYGNPAGCYPDRETWYTSNPNLLFLYDLGPYMELLTGDATGRARLGVRCRELSDEVEVIVQYEGLPPPP